MWFITWTTFQIWTEQSNKPRDLVLEQCGETCETLLEQSFKSEQSNKSRDWVLEQCGKTCDILLEQSGKSEQSNKSRDLVLEQCGKTCDILLEQSGKSIKCGLFQTQYLLNKYQPHSITG